ncbi:secreted RxLR effector protein 161-like [Monomorium pharaonis]|uniref:secreted RxLR effector protein 161-like n=1 Tax=Monomorium pharaonis TaxID=307658 RepID=UPI0017470D57|nr:secreted RxLR effector protein 161-like [Monomorium pharaonis]
MTDCNSIKTPAENQQPDETTNGPLDSSIPYRSAVGCLMYLACATRPDIAYAVSKVARSMAKPTIFDWISIKRIFRYLRGTANLGLHYTSTGGGLCAYSDADFAGDLNTRKSTNGFVSLIGGTAKFCLNTQEISLTYPTEHSTGYPQDVLRTEKWSLFAISKDVLRKFHGILRASGELFSGCPED